MTKPQPQPPTIAIRGIFQAGKSTTINGVTASTCTRMGDGAISTTRIPITFEFSNVERACITTPTHVRESPLDQINAEPAATAMTIALHQPWLRHVRLVDVPGHGVAGKAGQDDRRVSDASLERADAVVVIIRNRQLEQFECDAVLEPTRGKPLMVLMNCLSPDTDPRSDRNRDVARKVLLQIHQRKLSPRSPDGQGAVVTYNALWFCCAALGQRLELGDRAAITHPAFDEVLENTRESLPRGCSTLPPYPELLRWSNFTSTRAFLCGDLPQITTFPTIAALHASAARWRNAMLQSA